MVKRGQAPQPPRPLPPAPALKTPAVSGFFRADLSGGIELAWSASTGAASYRLVLAKDPGFASVVRDESLPGTSETLRDLRGGPLSWRVSAVDTDGLEGRPSAAGTVSVPEKAFPALTLSSTAAQGFVAHRRDVGDRHYVGGFARRPDLGEFDIVVYALVDVWYLQWYPYAEGKPHPVVDPDGYWEMRVNDGSRYKVYLVRKGSQPLPDARSWKDAPKVDGRVFLAEVDAKSP
jgi:hypothetical protein